MPIPVVQDTECMCMFQWKCISIWGLYIKKSVLTIILLIHVLGVEAALELNVHKVNKVWKLVQSECRQLWCWDKTDRMWYHFLCAQLSPKVSSGCVWVRLAQQAMLALAILQFGVTLEQSTTWVESNLSLFLSLRCIYLLSTAYDIHICLNINGTYEATPAAEVLRLSDYFSVPSEIGEAVNGYMEIHSPDFILNRAWVSCQVNTSTFTGVSYHSLLVKGVYVVTMELLWTHSPD